MAAFLTKSYVIAKATPHGWEVFHAVPGRNKTEAWQNVTQSVRIPKKQFVADGWSCHPIYICSAYGLPKGAHSDRPSI